jgi:hypothetical protein
MKNSKVALQRKDLKAASVAQAMLDAAQSKLSDASKGMESVRRKQRALEKRKQTILDSFIVTKKKK